MKLPWSSTRLTQGAACLAIVMITLAAYWPGLFGGFLFDDYPNIVDNPGVLPAHADVPSLVRAMLSSPSSELKRPLASLTFALNFLATGLDPFWMKLTNLVIHLANGALVFLVSRRLLRDTGTPANRSWNISAIICFGWLVLPINLTSVLYVVQRMESLANLAILAGIYFYVATRRRMIDAPLPFGLTRALGYLVLFALIGLLSKETSVLLPLFALLIEYIVYRGRVYAGPLAEDATSASRTIVDRRFGIAYAVLLIPPLIAGLCWLLPPLLTPSGWAGRDFTMATRLMSEARILVSYVAWTFVPLPNWLSFYHDDYRISTSLVDPWTTLLCLATLVGMVVTAVLSRRRWPLLSLGIGLYLASQLLTGTILPLELVYEHRNYFASFALLIATFPLLMNAPLLAGGHWRGRPIGKTVGRTLLMGLLAAWTLQTAATAYAWGDSIRLAEELADRAPESPRAQYELGRTYLIASRYDPASPFVGMAEDALTRATTLPKSTILPEQALIFTRARMHRPIEARWWDSMDERLRSRRPGVQDESSLSALTQCALQTNCDLPNDRMKQAFVIALAHKPASARLSAIYSDFAWGLLNDRTLAIDQMRAAVSAAPREPAYRMTLARRLMQTGQLDEARDQVDALRRLDMAGSLDADIRQVNDELSRHAPKR